MASKNPTTVKQYLDSLPGDRREALEAVRQTILANLDHGYEEGVQYGMIAYYVPHAVYPDGYHCDPKQPLPFASIASQSKHMAIYLFCIYTSEDDRKLFVEEWKKTGKKLDMGKSCVRFKKIDDVPLKVLGKAIQRATLNKFIKNYESSFGPQLKPANARNKTPKQKLTTKTVTKARTARKAVTRKKGTTKKGTK